MNIFYLDKDTKTCAEMHVDKHVVKMVLESAQMLSTAWREYSSEYADEHELYKKAHLNHPCSIWVRLARENYQWLYDHFIALCEEYTHRYGKTHASTRLTEPLKQMPFKPNRKKKFDLLQSPFELK